MYYLGSAGHPDGGVWPGRVHSRHSLLQKEMCAKETALRATKLTMHLTIRLIIIDCVYYMQSSVLCS
jgi:hypothetical protein